MHDLRILNGTVVTDGVARRLDVGIEGGQIAELDEPGAVGSALEEIDATGLHLIPGAIDVHFHCRAPSRPDRGDFASETAAAAAGGVTTIFEMPISDPACSTPEVFRSRRALAAAQSCVNFALYSGAAVGGAERAAEMAELGAIGFKLFTIAPAAGREREFSGLWATDEGEQLDALRAVQGTGMVCVIHAESDALVRYFSSLAVADNGAPPRPPVIEATAIATIAALAKEAGARIHIAHVSSRAALDALRGAHALGADVTAETCPQYLVLDAGAVRTNGGVAKVAPPLREHEDAEALWRALADGTLTLVASDHSPFLAHEKAGVPYAIAPQGLPTVELLVPVVLDAAVRGRLPLELAVGYLTSAPAKLFGLHPRKGAVAVGSDADIAVVALGRTYSPTPENVFTRAAGCAIVFAGMTFAARVQLTLVNGTVVYDDGRIVAEHAGRFTAGGAATLERA
jgi:allantoinase